MYRVVIQPDSLSAYGYVYYMIVSVTLGFMHTQPNKQECFYLKGILIYEIEFLNINISSHSRKSYP